jgi:hypothetical protein
VSVLWPRLCKALEYVVDQYGPIDGRTRLLKLVYLADRAWAKKHGKPYTEANYYRWNHGPFAREVLQALEWLDSVEILERRTPTSTGFSYRYHSGERSRLGGVVLDEGFRGLLDEQADRWRNVPLQELLDHVYSDTEFDQAAFGEKLLHA